MWREAFLQLCRVESERKGYFCQVFIFHRCRSLSPSPPSHVPQRRPTPRRSHGRAAQNGGAAPRGGGRHKMEGRHEAPLSFGRAAAPGSRRADGAEAALRWGASTRAGHEPPTGLPRSRPWGQSSPCPKLRRDASGAGSSGTARHTRRCRAGNGRGSAAALGSWCGCAQQLAERRCCLWIGLGAASLVVSDGRAVGARGLPLL